LRVTRRTPRFEQTRSGVGDSYEQTLAVDPARDETIDSRNMAPRRPSALVVGDKIGRYTVLAVLGHGGMGTVYGAHDPQLDRKVALKLLHDEHVHDGAERLVREAQALAKLHDPHVVTVYDAGKIDGRVYLAMQLVDGETLAHALERDRRYHQGNPSVSKILNWFAQAGRGLAAAHAAGLVHRDFKPTNVLIDRKGHVAVTDFGLARDVISQRGLTSANQIVGTPAYMSPEQHCQQAVTEASDQFSFCVALWEALFDQHPYVDEASRDSMSPFAIGVAIYDGAMIPPPRRTKAPRHVVEAITRGLARDPMKRWPSMQALLDVIAPRPTTRRMWPIAAAVTIAAAGATGVAVWLLARDPERPPCADEAGDRMAAVWNPGAAKQVADRFAHSGRDYAAAASQIASGGLDRYTKRWQAMAADVCTAERSAPDSNLGELAARRRTCLDGRLDALRTVIGMLAGEDRVEFVDRAQAIVDGLPDLADCADVDGLAAGPGTVPPALASKVTPLEAELQAAITRGNGGDYEHARAQLDAIAKQADAIGWGPLAARAHLALGNQRLSMLMPARDELLKAAELATANHLDRDAARAWQNAVRAAAFEKSPDAVGALAPVSRGTAARVHDPALQIGADVAYGRALVRLRKYKEGADVCRVALTAAQTKLDGSMQAETAKDCLVEALVPLGAYSELEPLLAQVIADRSKKLGADHPNISDYLGVQSGIDRRQGRIAEAHDKMERVLAIRQKAYPPGHVKIAEAMHDLAEVEQALKHDKEAKDLYEKALAIANDTTPQPLVLINSIHVALGFMAATGGDHKAALEHFESAVALTRKSVGNDSLELAILLLNYGQVKAEDNVDAGIGVLGEGKAILDRLHDKRAGVAGAAQAMILAKNKRWSEARKILEDALAHIDPDTEPVHIGHMRWTLAQALAESRNGDKKRAHKLALEAKQDLAKGGPAEQDTIKRIDAWLAKH
jgi:tetratricopeptide (TPR) repeat protein